MLLSFIECKETSIIKELNPIENVLVLELSSLKLRSQGTKVFLWFDAISYNQ